MTSEYTGNTFHPSNLMMFGGEYKNPYAGLASWSYDTPETSRVPALAGLSISQTMPDYLIAPNEYVPGLADKFRDFNSKYGSTIMGGLQAAAGLWGAFNGMQQNKLIKQQMANSLNQWNKNYANQVAAYNTRLEDRQRARVGANPNAYESVDSYMAKNRLK